MLWGFDGTVKRLMATGKDSEAAGLLRGRTLHRRKPSACHLNRLGVCEARLGHLELAKELFSQALVLSPRDAHALNNLGNLAYIARDVDLARDYYLQSLRTNVWAVEPRYNLIVLYQDTGNSEKALSSFEDYAAVSKAVYWARIAAVCVLALFLILGFKF